MVGEARRWLLDLRAVIRYLRATMKTAIFCLALAALAGFRVITMGLWNREHTADGFLGYEPSRVLLTLAIALLAATAGGYLIVKQRRSQRLRRIDEKPTSGGSPSGW